MNAVERVEDLAKNERQLTWIESRYWANQYLTIARELAMELDACRTQIHALMYKPKIEGTIHLGKTVQKSTGRVR